MFVKEDCSKMISFVQLVERSPCLWNYTLKSYSKADMTNLAWNKIATEMKETEQISRDRWRNIRTAFGRSLKPPKSGSRRVKKPYYLSRHLSFLLPYIKGSPSSGIAPPFEEVEESMGSFSATLSTADPQEVEINQTSEETSDVVLQSPPPKRKAKASKSDEDKAFADSLEIRKLNETKRHRESLGDDADWMFFQSMLPDFKKLSDRRRRDLKAKFLLLLNDQLDATEKETAGFFSLPWASSISNTLLTATENTPSTIATSMVDPLVSLMMVEKVPDSTYEMVGGLDKQIKEIKEVIELPVKHPELFDALGIAQPKGVLLYGPPGTGKTLLARAVAHHTECTFIRVSGSELVQKFIGEGSRMVRELFVMAREHAPSIIFMDEIDSIGSSRIESGSGGDSEVQRTMLELLNQLDGFEATKNIKVIMATNRIDILDPALLRPGRIDRKIEFPPPNEEARLDILKIHSRKMNLTRGIYLRKIAELMPGASGAEVKGVCTEAGMYALRERRVHVTQEDFEMAVAKVMQKDSEKNMSIKKLWK